MISESEKFFKRLQNNILNLFFAREMVDKIVAFFMALLIGNPVCCCAMVDWFAVEQEESSPPVHCCCMAAEDVCDEEKTPEPASCSCLLEKKQIAPDTQFVFLKQSSEDTDSISVVATDCATYLPHLPLSVIHTSKWPPGSLPTLSLSERLALNSSYLL